MCGTFTTVIDGRVLSELLVKEESKRKRKREVDLVESLDRELTQETLFPGCSGWILDDSSSNWMLRKAKWGLLPEWAKDESMAKHTFNARWESLGEKPAFKDAFAQERCIVPAKAWFEFRGPSGKKERIRYTPESEALFAMAGLRHCWKGKETFTVVTVPAKAPVAQDHDRMPLLLEWGDVDAWLESAKPGDRSTRVTRTNESPQASFLEGLL